MSEAVDNNGLFGRLPGELQNQIFAHLDYLSAVFLSRTNQYFRRIVERPPTPTDSEKLAIIHLLERTEGDFSSWFACHKCFRLKPQEEFGVTQILDRGKAFNYKMQPSNRFCIDCGLKGYYKSKNNPMIFDGYKNPQNEHLIRHGFVARHLAIP
ncbi:hypothetical protein BKA80DRAFT_338953 [Phyllosticta citrichinensis]